MSCELLLWTCNYFMLLRETHYFLPSDHPVSMVTESSSPFCTLQQFLHQLHWEKKFQWIRWTRLRVDKKYSPSSTSTVSLSTNVVLLKSPDATFFSQWMHGLLHVLPPSIIGPSNAWLINGFATQSAR